MKLTRIATVFIFAVLAADYSHACDVQKMNQCYHKWMDSFNGVGVDNYASTYCRSDVISYWRCMYDEGQSCGTYDKYPESRKIPSPAEIEKFCAINGHPISQNAAEQTLPTAVIIVGLFMALLFRTFSF